MARFLGLDKVINLWKIIRFNGGIVKSVMKIIRMDDLRVGKLVGEDSQGNKYYENPEYFYGRNRWVEYAEHVNFDYDGSQIPAEWTSEVCPTISQSEIPGIFYMPQSTRVYDAQQGPSMVVLGPIPVNSGREGPRKYTRVHVDCTMQKILGLS